MSILRQHPKSILSVKIFPTLILFIIPISRRFAIAGQNHSLLVADPNFLEVDRENQESPFYHFRNRYDGDGKEQELKDRKSDFGNT